MADLTQSLIQIKRSQGANAPAMLRPGELAYSTDETSGNGLGTLYVGGVGVDEQGYSKSLHIIGGKKYTTLLDSTAGVVTGGKAVIAGANGEVDKLAVGTLEGVVVDEASGATKLVVGSATGSTIIHDPYVAGVGEGGTNVALEDYIASLVEAGVAITAGAGIATIAKNESGAFVVGLAEVGTAGTFGSSSKIPAITVNAYGQVTAVEEKDISTVLGVDEGTVDLVSGKLATDDGIKSTQTSEGIVTVSVDDTVIRTTGGQTIAGTLGVEGQATFGVAPKVGADETVVTDATVGDALIYTSAIPTTKEVGGIAAGTTYKDGITVLNLIDTMLHPYVAPTSLTCSPSAAPATLECGGSATVKTVTVSWKNGSQQISKVEILNNNSVVGTKTLSSLATSATVTLDAQMTVNKDTTDKNFTAKIYDATTSYTKDSSSFTFVYPYYMGVVAADVEVTADVVKGLSKKVQGKTTTSFAYSTGGVAAQLVFAYPENHSDLKSVLDPNNFENIDSFTKTSLAITGLDGTSQTYKVYVANMNVDAFTLKFTHK